MALVLSDTQQCVLTINPVDKKGKPASVEAGSTKWTSSDATVATVAAEMDSVQAVVTAVGPGTCQINVAADADLGMGVATIAGTLDVTVTAGQAVSLGISTGTPSEQSTGGM